MGIESRSRALYRLSYRTPQRERERKRERERERGEREREREREVSERERVSMEFTVSISKVAIHNLKQINFMTLRTAIFKIYQY